MGALLKLFAAICGLLIFVAIPVLAKEVHSARQPKMSNAVNGDPFKAFPNVKDDACYFAKDHEAADLCAQWRAAAAAERAATAGERAVTEARRATNWAVAGIVASLVTVAGLIFSVWQTFGALGEAKRGNLLSMKENARASRRASAAALDTKNALLAAQTTADATVKYAVLMEQATQAQLRAYIIIDRMEVAFINDDEIAINIIIRNAGATPARISNSMAILWIQVGVEIDPAAVGPATTPAYHLDGWLPHNAMASNYVRCEDKDLIAKIGKESKGNPYIYGSLDYEDIFKNVHHINFAYRMSEWRLTNKSTFRPCLEGNGESSIGSQ